MLVILLSKLNGSNKNSLTLAQKNRVKNVVQTANKYIQSARKNINDVKAFHYLTKGTAHLEAAKQLVGVENLGKISGFNIGLMDKKLIQFIMN